MNKTSNKVTFAALALLAGLSATACERDAIWESGVSDAVALGLDSAAALVDPQAGRVLLLAPQADLTLE